MFRPSSLPILAKCGAFISGKTEFTEPGSNRHRLFTAMIQFKFGKLAEADLLQVEKTFDESDCDSVKWAADYFMLHSQHSQHPVRLEESRTCLLPDFSEMTGTPDATCHRDLFDLKSRPRNYREQMAAYVVLMCEENSALKAVNVHLLFTATQTHERYTLTHEEALEIVMAVKGKSATPSPCEYCSWCEKQLTCPAILSQVKQVANGYDQEEVIDIANWHPSEMTSGREIATGLDVASRLDKWCKSMKHHALHKALKDGLTIPGYELKPRAGKTYCDNVSQAFGLVAESGITQEQFLSACDLRMNDSKSKKTTGLTSIYAAAKQIKNAPAKRELLAKLAPVIKTTAETQQLVKVGESAESEE